MLSMIVLHIKRLSISDGVKGSLFCLFHRHIEQPLANFVNESRLLDTLLVFGKEFRMLPNEGGDGVELDCRWLETAVATGADKVFVSTDSASVTVQTHICRIAQAITLVERVACVFQHVPDVKTVTVVLKCLFVCHWLRICVLLFIFHVPCLRHVLLH